MEERNTHTLTKVKRPEEYINSMINVTGVLEEKKEGNMKTNKK